MKKITVITVCYNSRETIEYTMKSVLNQTYTNLEYVIVDGNSNDGTYEIVCSYEKLFQECDIHFKHISESDNGIFDAMNKATVMASGDFLIFINSDDLLASPTIIDDIFKNSDYDDFSVVYGNHYTRYNKYRKETYAEELDRISLTMPFSHQVAFIKRNSLLERLYNLKYNICADYDFFLYLYIKGEKFFYVDYFVSYFAEGGICQNNVGKTTGQVFQIRRDQGIINKKNYLFAYLRMKQYIFRQNTKDLFRLNKNLTGYVEY